MVPADRFPESDGPILVIACDRRAAELAARATRLEPLCPREAGDPGALVRDRIREQHQGVTALVVVSADDASAEETSAEETSVDEASVDGASAEETSADDASAEEASADNVSADDASADQASAEDPSANDPSPHEASADAGRAHKPAGPGRERVRLVHSVCGASPYIPDIVPASPVPEVALRGEIARAIEPVLAACFRLLPPHRIVIAALCAEAGDEPGMEDRAPGAAGPALEEPGDASGHGGPVEAKSASGISHSETRSGRPEPAIDELRAVVEHARARSHLERHRRDPLSTRDHERLEQLATFLRATHSQRQQLVARARARVLRAGYLPELAGDPAHPPQPRSKEERNRRVAAVCSKLDEDIS